MMRNNVVNYYGEYLFDGYSLCAKTGTAELDDKNPNCWIVGFSEDESTPYAFAVCVQEGTSGLYTAGEVVSAALNALQGTDLTIVYPLPTRRERISFLTSCVLMLLKARQFPRLNTRSSKSRAPSITAGNTHGSKIKSR